MRDDPDLFVAGVLTRDMTLPATLLHEAAERQESLPQTSISVGFRVADVRVEMNPAPGGPALTVPAAMSAFLAGGGAAEIAVSVDWSEEIVTPGEPPEFDSGGVWTLHRSDGKNVFVFRSPATGKAPYKLAEMDEEFGRGRVWLSKRVFGGRPAVYPLEYPLDELLVIHRLARGEGVEVHACGVLDEQGRGLLFAGHSGAGKSTMARLWQREGRAKILSDDRIIVRRDGMGALRIHGTPWHGEERLALPISAPLRGVFLLEHAQGANEFGNLAPARAAAELMARSFPPFHDAAGLEFSLQFFARLVTEVPTSIFRFVPDATAIREMERHG